MQCVKCNTNNRGPAKFCKQCGAALTDSKPAVGLGFSIDQLVGLDEIKKELSVLQAILEGMKQSNKDTRFPYDTIIIGASGTAKTLISNLIADLFFKFGMISKSKPEKADGASLNGMSKKDIDNLFSKAKGGMLFVDNAQKLLDSEGKAMPAFSHFIDAMDANQDDPVVLIAGLPTGLREMVKSADSANKQIVNHFEKIFIIPDYTPDQYVKITENELKKQSFTFKSGFSEKLLLRFRYLYKELQKPNNNFKCNGYLAIQEAQDIMGCYYLRKSSDKIILPEDIKGKIEEKKSIQEIMAELDAMTGMAEVKKSVRSIAQKISIQKEREEKTRAEALKRGETWDPKTDEKHGNHIVLTGNPGTGKTTVVRILAKLFEAIDALPTDKLIEINGNDLSGGYVGQTKDKVNDYCQQALGGVLFIDEAYVLVNEQGPVDDYAKQAAETLMTHLENEKDKFICIVAGYENNMNLFLDKLNPGMRSRFNHYVNIADYSAMELYEIFEKGFVKNGNLALSDEAKEAVKKAIEAMLRKKLPNFGNAREIRKLYEEVTSRQSARISALPPAKRTLDVLNTIEAVDIGEAVQSVSINDVLTDLEAMVGMKEVKETVRGIANKIAYHKKIMEQTGKAPDDEGNNICITGNPGTGKTTIVRTLAKLFKAIGLLSDDKTLEIQGADLKGSYLGHSKDKVNEYCRQAMGRVLFIDEAYSLVDENGPVDKFADEAITVLLAHLENDRDKFVCVVAGYPSEMDTFIKKSNRGMKRRFKHYIHIPDYSADELIEIFERFNVKKAGYTLTDAAREKAREAIRKMVANKGPTFGNAGDIRTFFEKITGNTANRVSKLPDDQQIAVLQVVEAEDIP